MSKFDKVAKFYNGFMKRFHMFKEEDVKDLLSLDNVVKILDVGAGTCHYSNYLSDFIDEVHAIDVSEKMLAYGNEKIIKKVHDITKGLPYEDHSFDAVIACDFLHHIPKKIQPHIFKEISRVLKKDGELIIYEFERKHIKTKLLHVFEFFIFVQQLSYLSRNEIIRDLSNDFTFISQKTKKNTFIIKGVRN